MTEERKQLYEKIEADIQAEINKTQAGGDTTPYYEMWCEYHIKKQKEIDEGKEIEDLDTNISETCRISLKMKNIKNVKLLRNLLKESMNNFFIYKKCSIFVV